MIKVYPVKVQAVDEDGHLEFTVETVDGHAAQMQFHSVIAPDNIDQLVAAMRRAVQMLELK